MYIQELLDKREQFVIAANVLAHQCDELKNMQLDKEEYVISIISFQPIEDYEYEGYRVAHGLLLCLMVRFSMTRKKWPMYTDNMLQEGCSMAAHDMF